jgi:hypothetical protein
MPYEFPTPPDMNDAELRMQILREAIADIEMQLGDRDRHGMDGERLAGEDYFTWRKRARVALRMKQAELGFIKGWVKHRREIAAEAWLARYASAPNACEVLLRNMVNLVGVLIAEHRYTLNDDERGLMAAARMLQGHYSPVTVITGSAVIDSFAPTGTFDYAQ